MLRFKRRKAETPGERSSKEPTDAKQECWNTEPLCSAVGGADDDIPSAIASHIAFAVYKTIRAVIFAFIHLELRTSTNTSNDVHRHQRDGPVGKEDFMDDDFELPCRISENLRVTAHSSNSALRRDRELKKRSSSSKTWYPAVVQGGMARNGRWILVR